MPHPNRLSPWRRRLGRVAPPAPLAALLAMVVIVGLAWALIVPPWQSPDEVAHFAYAQTLAENGRLPGAASRPQNSTDQNTADAAVGASRGAFFPQSSPPSWDAAAFRAYLAAERGPHPPSRTDGGGPNPASTNPPLYYGFADVAYLIAHSGTAFARLYAMQIWGVLLLLGSTIAAWLLAGEAFGRRRLPQLVCAAVVGLLPMDAFISTSVNPDALMITVWTFALWLGARVINRGGQTWDVVALCAVTAAGILTKATSYALVVPVVLALVLAWRQRPAPERSRTLRRITTGALALVLPVVGWVALTRALHRPAINQIASTPGSHPFNITQFLSYLWQFYLPRLGFMSPRPDGTPHVAVYDIYLRQVTGGFGWLDVTLPSWTYTAAAVIAAALAIAVVALLTRLRGRRALSLLAFFALTLVALLGLLHVTDYRSIIAGQGGVQQGRYLLPLMGLLGLGAALVVARLPARWRATSSGLALTGLLVLQVVSFVAVTQAYYL